ncbi:MAG: hypothetical protein ACOYBY_05430 [Dermatophilaceae bacterium]
MVQVESQITNFIVENFLFGDATQLPGSTDSLVENGVIDSTGVLELIEFLEAEFDIHVEDDETVPENLDSVKLLAAYVGRKRPLIAQTA